MIINGLEKLSLVDFNEKAACTIFLAGCNFRCPFCHNAPLIADAPSSVREEDFFDFLKKRSGLLDGVCITGGEPLLRPINQLRDFLKRIHEAGYLVKLDTNGSQPGKLRMLIDERLVDYVAMDIKNSPRKYAETVGLPRIDLTSICESIEILLSGKADYEFRSTIMAELHEEADFYAMGELIEGAERFFIQKFNGRNGTLSGNLSEVPEETAKTYADIMRKYVKRVELRGY